LRFRNGILIFTLVICLLACGSFSLAEEEVKVDVVGIDPAELTEAGEVLVTFEISNHSDYELSSLSIVQGDFLYQIPEETIIPVAGSAKIPVAVRVSNAQIGLPLIFMVSWHCGGEPYFINKEVTIERAVEPTISMTRVVSNTHARTGDKLTLTYSLKNDTKFDMTDIMLIDENISDNPIRRNDTLRANDSFLIEYTYTMGKDDVVSAPVVTYVVNGKTKSFSAVEPITLSMVDIDIRLHVERGTPSATGVPFTLLAENLGNQEVKDLVIKDEQGNLINNTPFSLEPDESQTISYTVAPIMGESVRNISFTLSGTDSFGDPCSSETTAVFPIYPFVDDSQIQVSIQGQMITEWTAQTGTVAVRLFIQNNSSVSLSNAVLSETSLGVLQSYPLLSNGQTVYEAELMIGSPRNLSFSLQVTDPAGTDRVAAEYLLSVAYPETTETPIEQTASPQQVAPSSGIWSNLITRVLIILGAIMIIAFAILLILTILERSHQASGLSLFEEEEEDDLFEDTYDSVETTYSMDEDDFSDLDDSVDLHNLQLFHRSQHDDAEWSRVPSFDDVMKRTTTSIPKQSNTQRISLSRTEPIPTARGQIQKRDSLHNSTLQSPFYQDHEAMEDTFFAVDDHLVMENDRWDPFAEDEMNSTAYAADAAPKSISVNRPPRTQSQRRNTIKRVKTQNEEKF